MPEALPKTSLGGVAEVRRVIVGLWQMADQERDGKPFDLDCAAEAMRALIEKIVLTPGKKRGEVKAELHGELPAILALTSSQRPRPALDDGDMRFSVVAGDRDSLYALFVLRGLQCN